MDTNLQNDVTPNISIDSTSLNTKVIEILVKPGDSLYSILKKHKIPPSDIKSIISSAKEKKINIQLKVNQKIVLDFYITKSDEDNTSLNHKLLILERMIWIQGKLNSIEFIKNDNGFTLNQIEIPLKKTITHHNIVINSNLISSLKKSGVNSNNINILINSYSHQIDFQRQIKTGDKIKLIMEKFITEDNLFSHYGNILYAELALKSNIYSRFSFSPTGKKLDLQFFSEDGHSVESTLLKTPVKVARISSNYGYRAKHPVLGYGKMHKGIDFAAPTGTPIYAAGTGVISFIGWKPGYGRFILIRHNKTLSTAYAHSSKFAPGLKAGNQVKQGNVIAFVGRSGNVTGPHLHYEVRVNDKQVNPMNFKSKPAILLSGKKLDSFHKYQEKIINISQKLENHIELKSEEIHSIQLYY